jgi:Xaa-Pro aminopeptidase
MSQRVCIPDWEFEQRLKKAAQMVGEKGLDVLIVNSNESDFANVRYFSNFWPLFERAGVAIAPSGKAALMVGPESEIFAADRSKIQNIFVLTEYRESANPAYPELKPKTFADVFKSIGVKGEQLKIGVASFLDTNVVIYEGLKHAFPNARIIDADDIMVALRSVKSENELACLREGFRITGLAMEEVVKNLKPGVSELAMVGIAQRVIYENGAEYEGLPMYVFSEKSTSHAISRPSYRTIEKGDIVQLNLSARVDGYSPSVGYPVSMGKLQGYKKEIVEFGLKAHQWTEKRLKAGIVASSVAKEFYNFYSENGYKENYLYGPCHGLGMIEVEAPWMETSSNYELKPNMTFQIDTFILAKSFGVRWETGIAITKEGCTQLYKPLNEIVELDV